MQILLIILILLTNVVSADDTVDPELNFIDPTPENNDYQTERYVNINISIEEENLDDLNYNWDGVNYTLYDDSLILMYNFNNIASLGESSSHVFDISDNENNGTVYGGASPTSDGKYDGAYSFDGLNDYITIGTIDFGQAFTVCTWIKPTAWGTSADSYIHNIFSNENGAGSTFAFRLGSKGQPSLRQRLAVAIYENDGPNDYESTKDLSLNTWQHVAATWDGNTIKFYVNGAFTNQQSAIHTMDSGTNTFMVAHSPEYNRPYAGAIDDLLVYNRVLNDTEIFQIYASNLKKHNETQWYLQVNQSKDATSGLEDGFYTYQAFATDESSNDASTEERIIYINVDPAPPVPEASTFILFGFGMLMTLGFIFYKRRRNH